MLEVDTVLRDLRVPWGLARTGDGTLFVSERSGRILALPPDSDSAALWATLDVYSEEPGIGPETGLLGIAVLPGTDSAPVLYALATTWRTTRDRSRGLGMRLWRRLAGRVRADGALKFKNQVLRLERLRTGAIRRTVVVDDLATNHYHAGGAVAFGPDGMLYFSLGDALTPALARHPNAFVGKILRYTPAGGVPADNPTAGSPVWATGLRNTQALLWLPGGSLLGTDHGPSGMSQEGGRAGNDELNLLQPGRDYGWPNVIGRERASGVVSPVWS